MKHLKILPKFFLYTLTLMLLIVVIAHALLYFLAPKMILSNELGESTVNKGVSIITAIDPSFLVSQTILKALPISLLCCILISVVCSLLFSRETTVPIKHISKVTQQMTKIDKTAVCKVYSQDEIGILAGNINGLYQNLLSTIENLGIEKRRVSESEKSKVDFLRAASHELKTPVTALHATLENMMLGVGKYRDYDTYLPKCKEITEQIADMIHDILETSKVGLLVENEVSTKTDLSELLILLCKPYELIAKAHGITFNLVLSNSFSAMLSQNLFSKAVSNLLANAVYYTEKGKEIFVYFDGHSIVIENECKPIPTDDIACLFEPFYRPDFARSREDGGNGLGLYLVDTLFRAMNITYIFEPMDRSQGMRFTIEL